MNTIMISSYLKYEHYENALDMKQGIFSAYAFLRERNHTFKKKK